MDSESEAIVWVQVFSDTGVPLLSRRSQNSEDPPFATKGLLSALFTAAQEGGAALRNISAFKGRPDDSSSLQIAFDSFPESQLVITWATSDTSLSSEELHRRINAVHDGLILFSGLEAYAECKQPAHFQALTRKASSFVQELVSRAAISFPNLASSMRFSFTSQPVVLSDLCGRISSLWETSRVAILSHGAIIASTAGWERLDIRDCVAFLHLVNSSYSKASLRDIPVYPRHSAIGNPEDRGNIAYRFVTVPLERNIQIVALLGNGPSVNDAVEMLALRLTSDHRDLFVLCQDDGLPGRFVLQDEIESSIFAFVFVSASRKRTFSWAGNALESDETRALRQRKLHYFVAQNNNETDENEADRSSSRKKLVDAYFMFENGEYCVALHRISGSIYILFQANTVPFSSMFSMGERLLIQLKQQADISICQTPSEG